MSEADKSGVEYRHHRGTEQVAVRGYDIATMGPVSFDCGGLFDFDRRIIAAIARLMDAILVSSIDHGATPPCVSCTKCRLHWRDVERVSRRRNHVDHRHHGGAIEDCARQPAGNCRSRHARIDFDG